MFKLIASKDNFSKDFLRDLSNIFEKELLVRVSEERFTSLKNYFLKEKINLNQLLIFIANSWSISEDKEHFIIYLDEDLKFKDRSVSSYISLIDYGNISLKGTLLIRDTFNLIKDNLFTFFSYQTLTDNI